MKKAIQNFLYSVGLDVKLVRPVDNRWLTNRNLDSVLDIGANTGQFAEKIHAILPEAQIYSFEPIKHCYEQLLVNTQGYKLKAFNIALGETEEEVEINVSKHTPSSSLLEMAQLHKDVFEGTDFVAKEMIQVQKLDSFADGLGNLGKFMVKIDVQGFEDRVIKGGENTIRNAELVVIETSFRELYKGQLLFNGIYNLLHDLGFDFKGNVTQTLDERDGSILYAESLFVKP